jgi:putative aminopeptidase FrvX
MSLIERLEKYCLTPAMAGFEEEMIKKLKADLKDHVDEIRVDVLGNVIATIKGTSPEGSDLMIFAHTDSLGMIVKGRANSCGIKCNSSAFTWKSNQRCYWFCFTPPHTTRR